MDQRLGEVAVARGTFDAHPLRGRRVLVATMHGKEVVLGPPLRAAFAADVVVASGLDTDRFGTFTGSVPRDGSALAAARGKIDAALALHGGTCAVASEGSFGPHPELPFVTLAAELVLLVDTSLGLEVTAEDVGLETNFGATTVASLAATMAFAQRVQFPSHQLVVAPPNAPEHALRGLGDRAALTAALGPVLRAHGEAVVSTDMRADRNPTRMRAIARAAQRLAERTATLCPQCAWPGFGPVDRERGLPCSACGEPTPLVRTVVLGCARCGLRQHSGRPDGRTAAEPGDCPACNP